MVLLLEALYAVTAFSALVAALAWVQSRSGGDRAERYSKRMRTALGIAIIAGTTAVVMYRSM
jgi:hypothetical protein